MSASAKKTYRPETRLVQSGTLRSPFGETSEAMFLTQGYVYDTAAQAEARFKGEDPGYQYSRFANPTVDMFERRMAAFEGAGLDGVVAKPIRGTYQPGKRAMVKIKHARTADCVIAGFRWHKSGHDAVGSLLLGLYDDQDKLQHVGVTSAFTMAMRQQLVRELAPLLQHDHAI